MKKLFFAAAGLPLIAGLLSGCSAAGEKTANFSWIYLAAAILSVLLFAGCLVLVKNRNKRMLLLFASIAVINIGYYWLAVSPNLTQALLANGLSYLGSACLPFFMLMIIFGVTKINYPKWLPAVLGALALIMFIIASSPLYSDIYYKSVYITHVNGVTVLDKEYGALHIVFVLYLLLYFAAMITVAVYATVKKKMNSNIYAIMLNFAVFVNIAVWLMEQFIEIEFELLSISYIVSELFLLGLFMIIQENDKKATVAQVPVPAPIDNSTVTQNAKPNPNREQTEIFVKGVKSLTQTESTVYNYYLEGKTTKEVMALLNITENTLKFHNKNIYGKLGVSSRRQLIEIAKYIDKE